MSGRKETPAPRDHTRCTRFHSLTAIVFLSGAPATAQTLESPHDLWDHMIAAKGGHERLQSVRTFAWTATHVRPTHRAWSTGNSIVGVAALPDRGRTIATTAFDVSSMSGRIPLEGTESVYGLQMPRWIRTGDDVRDLRFLINPELDAALFE